MTPLPHRGAAAPGWTNRREIVGRLTRLALKELRETLRDRRTIVTLVVMPLVLYPILALVFQRFLLTSLTSHGTVEYVIGVDSTRFEDAAGGATRAGRGRAARRRHERRNAQTPDNHLADELPSPEVMLARELSDAMVRRALRDRRGRAPGGRAATMTTSDGDGDGLERPLTWELYYRAGSPASEAALRYVETRLQAYSESQLDAQLKTWASRPSCPRRASGMRSISAVRRCFRWRH